MLAPQVPFDRLLIAQARHGTLTAAAIGAYHGIAQPQPA